MAHARARSCAASNCDCCWRFWFLPWDCALPSACSCGPTTCFPYRLRICDMSKRALISLTALCLSALPAATQINSSGDSNGTPQLQNPAEEYIEIVLSTETIAIPPNYGGTRLTIFGARDNAEPLIQL